MVLLHTAEEIINYRKATGIDKIVGLVPTMGALHEGHLSLIRTAAKSSDLIVVSIFVNPTQFNDPEDFQKYPRHIDKDLQLLSGVKVDAVFVPAVKDIYPEEDERHFDFGNLDKIMEGKHRPGHFNGVAQVVSRLFDLVIPHRAYFGQKDFQQLAIIKHMVQHLNYDVEIISCPTIRELDGLAMSSRNHLLTSEERQHASLIPQTLFQAAGHKFTMTVSELKEWVIKTISADPLFSVEYFEIVDSEKLTPVTMWEDTVGKTGCIAVKIGNVRLIDNIFFD